MKIAMIVRKLNVKGGTQRQMLSLARELRNKGHQIKIYTFAYSKNDCYEDLLDGFEVIVFVAKEKIRAPLTYYPNYAASAIKEGRESKKLALQMDKDFDLLNPHDQVAYKVAHFYKKLVKNIPSVWNMNDVPSLQWGYDKMRGVDENFRQPLTKRIFYRIFDYYDAWRYIRKTQDSIVVVDDFNRRLVKKYLRSGKAVTVRNGPDLGHFSYTKRTLPRGGIKILTSGILMPHRRFEDSINAVNILRGKGYNATLSIIGDYDNDKKYYQKLLDLVKNLKLEEYITFLGRVSEADLINAYQTHDVYIFQHHLQSDGLSPFEAVACGLPIIISKTAGSHEVLTDHENALFIEPKNPQDIADRVTELLENPQLFIKISEAGNTFVRGNFSWQKYADNVMNIFTHAISKN